MKTESINCNHCGAALQVPESANFVTCNFCESQLAVRRTDSVVFTELLEEIGDRQTEILERLESMERSSRIADLDRQWERDKERYMIRGKYGRLHEPTEVGAYLCFFVAAIGVVWTVVSASMFYRTPLFGFVFAAVAVAAGIYSLQKTKEFRRARRSWRRQRMSIANSPSPRRRDEHHGESS